MELNLILTFDPIEHCVELAKAVDELGWYSVNADRGRISP